MAQKHINPIQSREQVIRSSESNFTELYNMASQGEPNVIEEVQVNGTALPVDSNKAVNVIVPTALSQLSNDSGFITSADLPTVNNATLTIQKNGTNVATFDANASSNVTANITVPTNVSELANDSNFVSTSDIDQIYDGTSANAQSGVAIDGALQPIIAVAQGKTKSYVIQGQSDITGTKDANEEYTNVTAITGITLSDLQVGDIINLKDLNVPDYWVSQVSPSVSLSKMETSKVDLTNYVTTNTSQTINASKTFGASPILNNAIFLRGKDSGGTARNLIGISASNNVVINNENIGETLVGGGMLSPISAKNGLLDLGGASNKFKDLYLSGTIKDGTNTFTLPNATGTLALQSEIPTVPTALSQLTNDTGFITSADLPTIDTAISISSTNAVQNKAIPNYIASRGENLLTNGTALLQNNYNFTAFDYDGADTYYAGGCFKHTGGSIQPKTNEYMPVDVSQTYEVSYYARSSSTTSKIYDYLAMYDIDKNEIKSEYVMFISGSTTTLAQDLKNGDTKVYLTSVTGFNTALTPTYQRGLIFWNYKNSYGYQYGIETYSRNVYTNLWADSSSFDTTNNTITLSSAWNKGTIPAGTSVSQSSRGAGYTYMNIRAAGTTEWFKLTGVMSGVGKNNASGKFREGTAFVRLGWLINQNSEANVTWKLSTLSFAIRIPTSTSQISNDRFVRYDTASQGLNATQKSNARTNIGAGTSSFSGSYNDLTNKPTIPTKTSDITNDSGFITSSDIPTNISAFNNDSGYLTSAVTSLGGKSGALTLGSGLSITAGGEVYATGTGAKIVDLGTITLPYTLSDAQYNEVLNNDNVILKYTTSNSTQYVKKLMSFGDYIYFDKTYKDYDSNDGGLGYIMPTIKKSTKKLTHEVQSIFFVGNGLTYDTSTESLAVDTTTIALKSDIPTESTVSGWGFTKNTGTITGVQLNGTSIATSGVANVKALPNFNLNISHQTAGNPRPVKFLTINYATAATYFKMSATSCHDNGTSYQFLEDIIIGCTTGGSVVCNVYKYCQQTVTYDSATRNYGDVFYVIDTTNKIVDFYILCGQYASSQFTPATKIGNTTIAYITQYTGTATYYSSGTKVWANGNSTTYAKLSDVPSTSTFYPKSGGALNDGAVITMTGSNPYIGLQETGGTQYYLQGYQGEVGISVSGNWGTKRLSLDANGKVLIPSKSIGDGTYTYTLPEFTGTVGLTDKNTISATYIGKISAKALLTGVISASGTYMLIPSSSSSYGYLGIYNGTSAAIYSNAPLMIYYDKVSFYYSYTTTNVAQLSQASIPKAKAYGYNCKIYKIA